MVKEHKPHRRREGGRERRGKNGGSLGRKERGREGEGGGRQTLREPNAEKHEFRREDFLDLQFTAGILGYY